MAPKKIVTITGTGSTDTTYAVAYVTINGTKYASAATVQVKTGDIVDATVSAWAAGYEQYTKVTLNGATVLSGSGTYSHVVAQDCTINLSIAYGDTYGTVDITTT